MAGNTKPIVLDVNAKPAPQYYNPITDTYEYLQGRNGANKVELYGADGNPINIVSGKIDVKADDIEAILNTLAKQTTLASILAKADISMSELKNALLGVDSKTLSDVVAAFASISTSAKQDTIIGYIDGLEALVTAIRDTAGIKKIVDALPAGDNNIGNVDVVSSALPAGAATSAKQDSIITYIDELEALLTAIKDTAGIKKITDALPAGTNIIGSVKLSDGTDTASIGTDGSIATQVTGSFDTIRPMLGAAKTATSVASELFAGTSRLAGRRGLWIKNENWAIRLHVDGAGITSKTGVAIEPFASVIFDFDPAVDVPVYVVSEAGNIQYGVVEW